jgi:hypothetical protein
MRFRFSEGEDTNDRVDLPIAEGEKILMEVRMASQ